MKISSPSALTTTLALLCSGLVSSAAQPTLSPGDIVALGAPKDQPPTVRVLNLRTGAEVCAFDAYPAAFRGGVRVAVGDVNDDGSAEIITAPGQDEASGHVKVFDGRTGALVLFSGTGLLSGSAMDFAPFEGYSGGVFVAAADFNADDNEDIVVATDKGTEGRVKVFNGATGAELASITPFETAYRGGVNVAVGDVNGDGFADLVVGESNAGRGGAHVKVFDGLSFSESANIEGMGASFRGGVRVAVGDVTGDGVAEIITGGNGQVKVFSGTGGPALFDFFPYSRGFEGEVFVATNDVNADGEVEIVTTTARQKSLRIFRGATGERFKSLTGNPFFKAGDSVAGGDLDGDNLDEMLAGDDSTGKVFGLFSNDDNVDSFKPFGGRFDKPLNVAMGDIDGDGGLDIVVATGPGAGPHVKVFDGATAEPLIGPGMDFVPFDAAFRGGVNVAAGDVNGDGFDDTILGQGRGGSPRVVVCSGSDGAVLKDFLAYDSTFTGGVKVAAANVDTDGFVDIITSAGPGSQGHVKVFSGATGAEIRSFFAFPAGTTSGASVCVGDVNDDGEADIVVAGDPVSGPQVKVFAGPTFPLAGGIHTSTRPKSQNNLKQLALGVVEFDLDDELDLIVLPVKSTGKVKNYVFTEGGLRFAALESFFRFDPNYRFPQPIAFTSRDVR